MKYGCVVCGRTWDRVDLIEPGIAPERKHHWHYRTQEMYDFAQQGGDFGGVSLEPCSSLYIISKEDDFLFWAAKVRYDNEREATGTQEQL